MEYGSSFAATRAFGVFRSLQDTVYNMNLAHLTQQHRTVLRAPRRRRAAHGLHHVPDLPGPPPPRAVEGLAVQPHRRGGSVQARGLGRRGSCSTPTSSTRAGTGCFSTLGMPGQRDRHAGCVGSHLVENDLFDFLLFSLPDNDTYSHRVGPGDQPVSIAEADRALEPADGRRRGQRRVPGRPRRDRDVRPFAEPDRRRPPTWRPRSTTGGSCCRPTRRRRRPSSRSVPARARRRSTCSTRGALPRSPPRWRRSWARSTAWTWWRGWRARRDTCGASAARCASGPGATFVTPAVARGP